MSEKSAMQPIYRLFWLTSSPQVAWRLWNSVFTPVDRAKFPEGFVSAFAASECKTTGLWMRARNVSPERAAIEVARELGLVGEREAKRLLVLAPDAPKPTFQDAVARGDLVLLLSPPRAYWNGEEVSVDWHTHAAPWKFLEELCRQARFGRVVDSLNFGPRRARNYTRQQKSRLTSYEAFPMSLADLILPAGPGGQRLNLPRERVHIFPTEDSEAES